jgi:BMFP domain-containing protein YqiC
MHHVERPYFALFMGKFPRDRPQSEARAKLTSMDFNAFFEDLQARIGELARHSPARDLEQNVRALLQQGFAKFDLATREELALQTELLARARARLSELEARVSELEKRQVPPSV